MGLMDVGKTILYTTFFCVYVVSSKPICDQYLYLDEDTCKDCARLCTDAKTLEYMKTNCQRYCNDYYVDVIMVTETPKTTQAPPVETTLAGDILEDTGKSTKTLVLAIVVPSVILIGMIILFVVLYKRCNRRQIKLSEPCHEDLMKENSSQGTNSSETVSSDTSEGQGMLALA